MLEKIIAIDKELFVFFNNLGSTNFDDLWLIITKQESWVPFFVYILYLLYKKIGLRNFLISIVFIALLILLCDQTANLFKENVARLRPCNTEDLINEIRIVKHSDTFSYFSGHATSSMATSVFVYFIVRNHYKYFFLIFLFPLIFAYSRIYLGLHFPLDILSGYIFGATFGFIFYKIFQQYVLKNF